METADILHSKLIKISPEILKQYGTQMQTGKQFPVTISIKYCQPSNLSLLKVVHFYGNKFGFFGSWPYLFIWKIKLVDNDWVDVIVWQQVICK